MLVTRFQGSKISKHGHLERNEVSSCKAGQDERNEVEKSQLGVSRDMKYEEKEDSSLK